MISDSKNQDQNSDWFYKNSIFFYAEANTASITLKSTLIFLPEIYLEEFAKSYDLTFSLTAFNLMDT